METVGFPSVREDVSDVSVRKERRLCVGSINESLKVRALKKNGRIKTKK